MSIPSSWENIIPDDIFSYQSVYGGRLSSDTTIKSIPDQFFQMSPLKAGSITFSRTISWYGDVTRIKDKDGVIVATTGSDYPETSQVTAELLPELSPYTMELINASSNTYTGTLIHHLDESLTVEFAGDFLPLPNMSEVPLNVHFYPSRDNLSTTVGTGVLNGNPHSVFVGSVNRLISGGRAKHFLDSELNSFTSLLLDGDSLYVTDSNGNVVVFTVYEDEISSKVVGQNVIVSTIDGRIIYMSPPHIGDLITCDEILTGDSLDYLELNPLIVEVAVFLFAFTANNTTWSNKETREQANPYPPVMQNVKPVEQVVKIMAKFDNYNSSINQKGEQRPIGYYQSTVMINRVPIAGKRVFCLNNHGQLMAETISDKNGVYRFDYLLMDTKYMFVAQHSYAPDAPPEYNAVASDWQTPTKYGE